MCKRAVREVMKAPHVDACTVLCFDHQNVWTLMRNAQKKNKVNESGESESTTETFETFKMECGDRRIPLTLRAVI